jgi:hypothetical protein
MRTLTKDQMQKLTPEQQEAFASMVTSDFRWRQELLKLAHHRWIYRIVAGIFFAASVGLAIFQSSKTPILSLCIVLLALLVQIHAMVVHQRLDALLKLLDAELRRRPEKEERG